MTKLTPASLPAPLQLAIIVSLLLASASAFAAVAVQPDSPDSAAAEAATDEQADERPAVVRMSMLSPAVRLNGPSLRLLGFSWNDCGGAGAWVKIHSASLQPDPVRLTGKITIAFSITVTHSFGAAGQPLTASVKIDKKIFGAWIKLPCVDSVGSCDYPNLCKNPKPPATCPPEFVKAGVPCKCPFPAGNYTLAGYSFTIDASKVPKFLESGSYKMSLNLNAGGNQVLCANAELSLD